MMQCIRCDHTRRSSFNRNNERGYMAYKVSNGPVDLDTYLSRIACTGCDLGADDTSTLALTFRQKTVSVRDHDTSCIATESALETAAERLAGMKEREDQKEGIIQKAKGEPCPEMTSRPRGTKRKANGGCSIVPASC